MPSQRNDRKLECLDAFIGVSVSCSICCIFHSVLSFLRKSRVRVGSRDSQNRSNDLENAFIEFACSTKTRIISIESSSKGFDVRDRQFALGS